MHFGKKARYPDAANDITLLYSKHFNINIPKKKARYHDAVVQSEAHKMQFQRLVSEGVAAICPLQSCCLFLTHAIDVKKNRMAAASGDTRTIPTMSPSTGSNNQQLFYRFLSRSHASSSLGML